MPVHSNIHSLFAPKTIVVSGQCLVQKNAGFAVLQNLINAGYEGSILTISAQESSILGLPAFRKAQDIPEQFRPLDLVVISNPADEVCEVLKEFGAIGTKAAIVISEGFRETGRAGALLERDLSAIATKYHMALLGPNCLGLISTANKMNLSLSQHAPLLGHIGFFSQSSALCVALYDWAHQYRIGFSSFVSLGNKAILNESDILAYLAADPNTNVIVGYLENIEDGVGFLHNAHAATRQKPVILLKAGRTTSGARAFSSHTGELTGPDMAFDAACKQAGIIRANTLEELFTLAHAFTCQPLPKGPGVAIISNAGGPGIVASDTCENTGLSLARLSQHTITELKKILPSHATAFNPVDVTAHATPQDIALVIRHVLADPAVHSLVFITAPTFDYPVEEIATLACHEMGNSNKPTLACLMGGSMQAGANKIFNAHRLPFYPFPESALSALGTMYRQSQWTNNPMPIEVSYRKDLHKAKKIIDEARKNNELEIGMFQGLGILHAYEMPTLEAKLARTSDEAVQIAKQLGMPVALKIASPQIAVHKTDIDGVILGLDSPEKIKSAFLDLTSRASRLRKGSHIAGCLVQAMAPAGAREVIVGFKRDKRFGPLLFFSLGGIHAEVFKDFSYRLAPLDLNDVHNMVREVKAFPVLAGMKGQRPIRFTAIEDILLIMSQLALDFPEIQEAECNPIFVNEHSAFVADIKAALAPNTRPR